MVLSNRQTLNLLKTSKGQLEGIIKMIEDDRYCVDISKQILAVEAQLKKVNLKVLDSQMKSCLKSNGCSKEKIDKIITAIMKYKNYT